MGLRATLIGLSAMLVAVRIGGGGSTNNANATFTDDMHASCLQFFYLVYGDVLTVDEAIAGLSASKPALLRTA